MLMKNLLAGSLPYHCLYVSWAVATEKADDGVSAVSVHSLHNICGLCIKHDLWEPQRKRAESMLSLNYYQALNFRKQVRLETSLRQAERL